jgi:hypothetical protein
MSHTRSDEERKRRNQKYNKCRVCRKKGHYDADCPDSTTSGDILPLKQLQLEIAPSNVVSSSSASSSAHATTVFESSPLASGLHYENVDDNELDIPFEDDFEENELESRDESPPRLPFSEHHTIVNHTESPSVPPFSPVRRVINGVPQMTLEEWRAYKVAHNLRCKNCRSVEHLSRECTVGNSCFICGETGHVPRNHHKCQRCFKRHEIVDGRAVDCGFPRINYPSPEPRSPKNPWKKPSNPLHSDSTVGCNSACLPPNKF